MNFLELPVKNLLPLSAMLTADRQIPAPTFVGGPITGVTVTTRDVRTHTRSRSARLS